MAKRKKGKQAKQRRIRRFFKQAKEDTSIYCDACKKDMEVKPVVSDEGTLYFTCPHCNTKYIVGYYTKDGFISLEEEWKC